MGAMEDTYDNIRDDVDGFIVFGLHMQRVFFHWKWGSRSLMVSVLLLGMMRVTDAA